MDKSWDYKVRYSLGNDLVGVKYINHPKFSFYRVYIETIHNYQDPKEMDPKTSSSIFSFLFQAIKENIKSDLQVELMRWLVNCCP
jgi:hypothetical protein